MSQKALGFLVYIYPFLDGLAGGVGRDGGELHAHRLLHWHHLLGLLRPAMLSDGGREAADRHRHNRQRALHLVNTVGRLSLSASPADECLALYHWNLARLSNKLF